MSQWYQDLFQNYGISYDSQVYTGGTLGECDFIEAELGHNKQLRILDIGCGTGRHSIELSRRGYQVTGIDLSESMLNRAKEKALAQNLEIDFQLQDARQLPFLNQYDAAIMLCEGAFALMETDEMNFLILQNAAKALRPDGKLIFTTLNGLFPLFHSVKDFINKSAGNDSAVIESTFNLMTFRENSTLKTQDDSGNKIELQCNERYYVPSEITWLLKTLDFKEIDIYGARLGAYSRHDRLTPEDFEMLIIAQK